MKQEHFLRKIAGVFAVVLVLYCAIFFFIEHLRSKKGPWEVEFRTDAAGIPTVIVSQPTLQIARQALVFPQNKTELTNFSQTLRFAIPTNVPPFGELVFHDLTFLPGTLTFNFWGHEVEFLPRIMTIDKVEHPWKSESVITITGPGKYVPKPPSTKNRW